MIPIFNRGRKTLLPRFSFCPCQVFFLSLSVFVDFTPYRR